MKTKIKTWHTIIYHSMHLRKQKKHLFQLYSWCHPFHPHFLRLFLRTWNKKRHVKISGSHGCVSLILTVAPCRVMAQCQRFIETYCLHHQPFSVYYFTLLEQTQADREQQITDPRIPPPPLSPSASPVSYSTMTASQEISLQWTTHTQYYVSSACSAIHTVIGGCLQ